MKILIVDDNATNRKLLRVALEAEGFTTTEAADGVEALARLEEEPVDAIISDIFMPYMDGFQLCYEVRKHVRFGKLPFLIYSATYTAPADEKLAKDFGADRYLRKPCPIPILINALYEVAEQAQQRTDFKMTTPAEVHVMKEYSETLVQKLESKNAELRRTQEALRQSHDELEQTVKERTAKLAQTVELLREEVGAHRETNSMLAQRTAQLRALASELTLTEQRERHRLAEILHDHLQQLLVAAKLQLSPLLRAKESFVSQISHNVEELLSQSIDSSRNLTSELSPPILYEDNLEQALEWLRYWMQAKHGFRMILSSDANNASEPEDVKVLLFQAVRELLFNVVKHAGVTSAEVRLRRMKSRLQVTVRDKGKGFDVASLRRGAHAMTGFGLFSIQERLSLLGGGMTIRSLPGHGSTFRLTAPIRVDHPIKLTPMRVAGAEAVAGSASLPPAPLVSPDVCEIVYSTQPKYIRLLLVDDHTIMREGMAQLLSLESDIQIVGGAADGHEAVEKARLLRPDVIMMDINMPGLSGVEATRIIHSEIPEIRIIGLSMFMEHERADEIRQAGAVAYLSKSGATEILISTIRLHGSSSGA